MSLQFVQPELVSNRLERAGIDSGAQQLHKTYEAGNYGSGQQPPTTMEGQTQYGGQNYNTTHATHNWTLKEIPVPRQILEKLDEYVVGQAQAKRVSTHSMLVMPGIRAGSMLSHYCMFSIIERFLRTMGMATVGLQRTQHLL